MENIRRYFKRTDKTYLLLCIFSSVMAVTALSSWAAKQGNGFAVDEITAPADLDAIAQCSYCGVRLLATAHASGVEELHSRPLYRRLCELGVFEKLLILDAAKRVRLERMD